MLFTLILLVHQAKATEVNVGEQKSIEVSRQDTRPQSLYTNNLHGSIATAIYLRFSTGKQYAFLMHNLSSNSIEHLNQIKTSLLAAVALCKQNKAFITSLKIINAVPGDWSTTKPKELYKLLLQSIKLYMEIFARDNNISQSDAVSACYSELEHLRSRKTTKLHDFEIVLYPNADKSAYFEKGSEHQHNSLNS